MPAFPQPFTSTVSHWQATNRGPTSLWNHGRDAALPTEVVDYVIIGAGVTGASLAYHLTRPGVSDGKRLVVLEAKDVASGASGRNGGHIAPHGFRYMADLCTPLENGGAGLTEDDALDVHFFELDNLDYIEGLVRSEKLDVDFWRGTRIEAITSREASGNNHVVLRKWQAALKRYGKANCGQTFEVISDPEEAKRISRIPAAIEVNKCLGGSWHPHRATTALLRLALESTSARCELYSWTPVVSFTQTNGLWDVDCGARGTVRARNVVLATNGYTRHMFPNDSNLQSHIVPWRLSAGLVTPPPSFSGAAALMTTVSAEGGPYLIHTPHSGLVLGPYVPTIVDLLGPNSIDKVFGPGVEDDSFVFPAVRDWIANYCKNNFDTWGTGHDSEGLARVWTGVLGWSVDHVPLVGEVPRRAGLWVAAGYNGMGMATIVNITRHLARIMKTGQWEGIPACFKITEERLARAKSAKPVQELFQAQPQTVKAEARM